MTNTDVAIYFSILFNIYVWTAYDLAKEKLGEAYIRRNYLIDR